MRTELRWPVDGYQSVHLVEAWQHARRPRSLSVYISCVLGFCYYCFWSLSGYHVYGYQSLIHKDWFGACHALYLLGRRLGSFVFGVYGWIGGLWNHHLYTRVNLWTMLSCTLYVGFVVGMVFVDRVYIYIIDATISWIMEGWWEYAI